ncbi:YlxR family protein [Arthrobacter sp. H14]|uniref:YlxR family protein n=1 Tax=Arthrobacter sp. H14 TaxID=1312959 RepID=UPI00055F0C29|nr:YlxR family protein [Arthrobacter sp. H14]
MREVPLVVTTKRQPLRTCIGCRNRAAQSELLRVVATNCDGTNAVVVDARRRMAGRGAWLHPSRSCLVMAVKRRAFNRAFRGQVETRNVESYFNAAESTGTSGGPMTTVQPESGSVMKMETR